MSRRDGAIQAVRQAIATAADFPLETVGPDEDIVDDLSLDDLDIISLQLILEEVFSVEVPVDLFESPLHRTAETLAEWLIEKSDQSDWQELQRQRHA